VSYVAVPNFPARPQNVRNVFVKVKSVDDKAAKAVKGVRQIVRLEDAVAVVADHMGAAKKGLASHLSLNKDAPLGRGIQRYGTIAAIPVMSGLHHRYVRI
jgi:hypothetical protein